MSLRTYELQGCLDKIIYWAIVILPFSIAICPAAMNGFMVILIVAFLVKKILKKEWLFKKNAIGIPVLFLFVITCVSVINTVCLKDSLRGGVFRLAHYILVLFIMAEEVRDKRHIRNILFSMSAGIVLVSINGIFQVTTGRDFIRGYKPILNIGLVRATASFKDANILGIYLSALCPLAFGFTLYYFKKGMKILMLLVSVLALVGIGLTYSRPTLLAVYIALFFFAWAKKDKLLISILAVLTIAAPFIAPRPVKDWAKAVKYDPLRFMCNDDRIAVYRNSINMIKAHPFIGVGAGAYMKSYKNYKEVPEYRNVVTLGEMKAHNNFLHMAGEIGLSGLAIFLWLLYRLFKESRVLYLSLKDDYLKLFSFSLTVCLISFLINGLTESSLYYSVVAILFWYMAGLLLALKKFI